MIAGAIKELARHHDVIVTVGGASVGDHDHVRSALEDAGGRLDFWKVAMRPGKPLIAGTIGNALLLGLPGNPGSAFATATLFLLPLVRHLAGAARPPAQKSAEPPSPRPSPPEVAAATIFMRALRGRGCTCSAARTAARPSP